MGLLKSRHDPEPEVPVSREQARLEARAEKQRRKEQRQREKDAKAYAARLAKHKKMFRCHVRGCKNTSNGPARKRQVVADKGATSANGASKLTYVDQWDVPTGMALCLKCGELTCSEHLYRRMCPHCGRWRRN